MDRSHPALLIIDMFSLFDFEQGPALAKNAYRIAPAIARLRARFDQAGAPVIYVNDNFAQWQGEFRDLVTRCLATDGLPASIARLLAPNVGHYYILKPKHSAFLATPLPLLLAQLGVKRLVLCGISTDSCILASAQDANMREHDIWCPGDAVAASREQLHEHALELLARSLGACTDSTRRERRLFPEKR